jgi:hypothetical protein
VALLAVRQTRLAWRDDARQPRVNRLVVVKERLKRTKKREALEPGTVGAVFWTGEQQTGWHASVPRVGLRLDDGTRVFVNWDPRKLEVLNWRQYLGPNAAARLRAYGRSFVENATGEGVGRMHAGVTGAAGYVVL